MLRFSLHKMSNCLSFVAGISHNHLHSCAINQAFKRWWLGLHLERGSRATMHRGNSLFASLLLGARWKCVCFWVSVCVSFVCVQLIAGGGEIRSRFPKYWSISFLSPYIRKCCETYGAHLRAKKNNCHLCICLQVWAGSCVCMYVWCA